jgi:hypothetical protein
MPEYEAEIEVTHWFDIDSQIRLLAKTEAARLEDEKNKKNYVVMLTADNADGGKRATLALSASRAFRAILSRDCCIAGKNHRGRKLEGIDLAQARRAGRPVARPDGANRGPVSAALG